MSGYLRNLRTLRFSVTFVLVGMGVVFPLVAGASGRASLGRLGNAARLASGLPFRYSSKSLLHRVWCKKSS